MCDCFHSLLDLCNRPIEESVQQEGKYGSKEQDCNKDYDQHGKVGGTFKTYLVRGKVLTKGNILETGGAGDQQLLLPIQKDPCYLGLLPIGICLHNLHFRNLHQMEVVVPELVEMVSDPKIQG